MLLVRSVTQVDESLAGWQCGSLCGNGDGGELITSMLPHWRVWIFRGPLRRAPMQRRSSNTSSQRSRCRVTLKSILCGAPVGIVGLGAVGGQVAQRLLSLGCQVVGYDPLVTHWPTGVLRGDLKEVLSQTVVSLHASLHDQAPLCFTEV